MSNKPWLTSYPTGISAEITLEHHTIADMFERRCEQFSDRIAYDNMGCEMTFAQLQKKVHVLSAFFQQQWGLKKGDRLAIMLPNLLQHPVTLFAALRAGLIVVNVNPLYTARELAFQLQDTDCKAIVVLSNFAQVVEAASAETVIEHVLVTQVGDLFPMPKALLVNSVVKYVKKAIPNWHLPQADLFKQAMAQGDASQFQAVAIRDQDIALLQPTSGTTGVPKSAMLSHANMMANMAQISAWISSNFGDNEVMITALPMYHIFSLCVNGLAMLNSGVKSILITNPRDIKGFVNTLKNTKFSVITAVNTLLNALANNKDFAKLDFSHLHTVVAGGMALQKSVAEHWHEVTGMWPIEGYGLTETSPVVAANPIGSQGYNASIGLPLPSTDVEVRDDNGQVVPAGEVGELCVKGPQVMMGYWQKPEETENVFYPDGWLRTGDIATVDEEGFIHIVDRKKNMILVSGFNVYPNEVEDVLAGMPGVIEAAVVGVAHEYSGEVVKAFVVKDDDSLTKQAVIGYCRGQLASYKVPKQVEFRDALPKNPVGKILHRELRDAAA